MFATVRVPHHPSGRRAITVSISARPSSSEFVQSLDRGLAVIRAFGANRPSLTLSEVARTTGLSRAVARRFLHTLVELGYLGYDGTEFRPRPRLLELGYAYLSSLGLPDLVRPHLQRLSDEVGESTSVAVLDELDIVYVAREAVYRIMAVSIGVGTRFPALVTSMGRAIIGCGPLERQEALLARAELTPLTPRTLTDRVALRERLATVREQGWALVDQELEEGLRAVAAPIRDVTGEVVAALNISAPVRRGDLDEMEAHLVDPLRETARAIEADLARVGWRHP